MMEPDPAFIITGPMARDMLKDPLKVDGNHQIPFFIAGVLDQPIPGNPGIVDQNIDVRVGSGNLIGKRRDAVDICHIQYTGYDVLRGVFQRLYIHIAGINLPGPGSGEAVDNLPPDSPGSPGYDTNFAIQNHYILLKFLGTSKKHPFRF